MAWARCQQCEHTDYIDGFGDDFVCPKCGSTDLVHYYSKHPPGLREARRIEVMQIKAQENKPNQTQTVKTKPKPTTKPGR